MHYSATGLLLPRGVYEMPCYAPNGARVACAIASDGRALQWVWFDEATEKSVSRTLWDALDTADPVAYLKAI